MTTEQTALAILILNIIITVAGLIINFLKSQQTQAKVDIVLSQLSEHHAQSTADHAAIISELTHDNR